jgi:EAL domain-containing protein (putative c-di-GMP-specific phosphodiesterase class I)
MLGFVAPDDETTLPDAPASSLLAAGQAGEDLCQKLAPLWRNGTSTLGANVQIIGLGELKEKVGDHWARYRDVVHLAVEKVFEKTLAADDRYVRLGEDIYIVAFGDADPIVAAKRTEAIKAEIMRQLLGDEGSSSVSVQVTGGRIDVKPNGDVLFVDGAPKGDAASKKKDDLHWSPFVAGVRADDVVDWAQRPAESSAAIDLAPAPDVDEALQEAIRAHGRRAFKGDFICGRRAYGAAGGLDDEAGPFDYRLGFVPVWSASKGAITTYAVFPYWHQGDRWRFEREVLGDAAGEQSILALDVQSLRAGIKEAARLYANEIIVLTTVLIHYQSLMSKQGLAIIQHECAQIPEFMHKYISIVLIGTPARRPGSTLVNAVSMLRRHVRAVIARAKPGASAQDLKAQGFDGISIALGDGDFGQPEREAVQRWMTAARAAGLLLIVEYVPSGTVAAELVAMGADHMSGMFIGEPVAASPGVSMHTLDDFPLG